MAKKKRRPGVAKRKTKAPQKNVGWLAHQIIYIMTLTQRAIPYLKRNKRLPEKLEFQLRIEVSFAVGMLLNLFGLEQSFINSEQKTMQDDEEQFKKDLDKFCNMIDPNASKPKLYTVQEFEKELAKKHGKQQPPTGRFIMP